GLAPPAPCRSPGAPVSKRARAKNAQNCFLYRLLPTVVASAIGFQIDEIEMEFLQENSAWEFSHSLGLKRKCRRFHVISALPHKSDINCRDCDVRFCPTEGQKQKPRTMPGAFKQRKCARGS